MDDTWRWADPTGQQRRVRTDELRAALAGGEIAPNTPVWRAGWKAWQPAHEVAELNASAMSAANGVALNIPPPPLALVTAQHEFEARSVPPPPPTGPEEEPPPPPAYQPMPTKQQLAAQAAADAAAAKAAADKAAADRAAAEKAAQNASTQGTPSKPPPPLPPGASKPPPPVPNRRASGEMSRPAVPAGASSKPSKPPPPVPKRGGSGEMPKVVAKPENVEELSGSLLVVEPQITAKKENVEELSGSLLVDADASGTLPSQADATLPNAAQPSPAAPPAPASAPKMFETPPQAPQVSPAPPQMSPNPPQMSPNPPQMSPNPPPSPMAATGVVPPGTLIGGIAPVNLQELQNAQTQPATVNVPGPGPTLMGGISPPMLAPPTPLASAPVDDFRTKLGGLEAPQIPPSQMPGHPPEHGYGQNGATPHAPPYESAMPPPTGPHSVPPPTHPSIPPMDSIPPRDDVPAFAGVNLPPALNKLAHRALALQKKNKLALPVAGVIVGMIALLFLALLVSAVRSCGSSSSGGEIASSDSASPSASLAPSANAPPTSASSELTPSDTVRVPPPADAPKTQVTWEKCALQGDAQSVASKAVVAMGVETTARAPGFAVGYGTSAREGMVVPLGADLAPGTPAAVHSPFPIKRVVPAVNNGMLVGIADLDRRGDKLGGRRTVIGASTIDVGVNEGAIAWAPHGSDSFAALFTLEGDARTPVEALRGVPLAMEKGYAIAFRRGNAIWIGIATGDSVLTPKRFSTIQGAGDKVGSPSIAVSGDAVVVAWADRTGPKEPWSVRLARFSPRDTQPAVVTFAPPAGGPGTKAMSPSVAGLGAGKYVLAWSEGPPHGERVRSVVMNGDGTPAGDAFDVSPEDANAGMAQIAINPDGKGAIGFLADRGRGYEVMVRALNCTH